MAITSLFMHGPFANEPILTIVLGRALGRDEAAPGFLADASVQGIALRQGGGGQVPGRVLQRPDSAMLQRLDFFAACFGAKRETLIRGSGEVDAYIASHSDIPPWRAGMEPIWREAAREIMAHKAARGAEQVAGMLKAVFTRAGARVRAAQTEAAGFTGQIDLQRREIPYANFFAISDMTLRAQTFDGQMSAPLERAVFMAMDAAIVLPYDPVRDRVLIVEQIRMGPICRGDPDAWQFEPVAGHVDPGETPPEAAHREAQEEASLTLHGLEPVANCYPSPGASAEYYYIYVGLCDLPDGTEGVAGMASEGENIRSHLVDFCDLMDRIDAQRISAAPLVLAGLWLARHRSRLRRQHI